MPNYRRYRIPGGGCFFTVNLLQRQGNDRLIREIELLRATVRCVRDIHPFHIDGWVVLAEHMHCIWTLPPGDDDYSGRWRAIKAIFSEVCLRMNAVQRFVWQGVNVEYGNDAFGSMPSVMIGITPHTWIICILTRLNTATLSVWRIGLIQASGIG